MWSSKHQRHWVPRAQKLFYLLPKIQEKFCPIISTFLELLSFMERVGVLTIKNWVVP